MLYYLQTLEVIEVQQRLTDKQLSTLSDAAKSKLLQWCQTRPFYSDFGFIYLTIGQMIEFLGWEDMEFYKAPAEGEGNYTRWPKEHRGKWCVQDGDYENATRSYWGDELCDALWEAVKDMIEK